MESFEEKLDKAIKKCNYTLKYYHDFFRVYTFTTENISDYIKYFDLKNKSLLTVGSSGDQVLNAFCCGARDITLFDINEYALYYLYLKVCSILTLDYKEFQEFFFKRYNNKPGYSNEKMFLKDTFDKIKSTLRLFNYEAYLFYDELFHLYSPITIRENLFNDDEDRNIIIKNFNIYLKNEKTYNELKKKLNSFTVKYINGDILKDNLKDKYDNIFLSNISTVIGLEKFKELIKKMDNNLNNNGSMLLAYLWNINFNEKSFNNDWHEIYNMKNTSKVLSNYISEYHDIKSPRDIIFDSDDKEDLVLIYRKK